MAVRLSIPLTFLRMVIVFALVAVPLSMVQAHTSSDVVGSSIHATHTAPDAAIPHMDHSADGVIAGDASDCTRGSGSGSDHSGTSMDVCCFGMCLADAVVAGSLSSRDRVRSQFVREAPTAFKCADLIAPHSPPRA